VFLFDEPLSNLDAKMRAGTRAELSRLHARLGATMVYVTHDQMEAMTMGDSICVMQDGRIRQVAPPLELYDRPANLFVAGFIGNPSMNLVRGTLGGGAEGPVFVEDNAKGPPLRVPLDASLARLATGQTGRSVVLGVRPEHIVPDSPATSFTARVDVVEPMGAETFVHLDTGAHALVARFGPHERPARGDVLSLGLVPGRLHLFDAASGEAIR
jgi:multiple sugar transport system ATP-binding protein